MHMSFYFSSTVYDFLFSGVNIITVWGMVSLCLGLVSLSVFAEGFKVARSQLLNVILSHKAGPTRNDIPERSPLLMSDSFLGRRNAKLLYKRRVKFHIFQSFLHVVHLTVGYILMLVVMTYNAYFAIAVVGGAGLGYYFFALFDLPSKVLGANSSNSTNCCTNHTQGPEDILLQASEDHVEAEEDLSSSSHASHSIDENHMNEEKKETEKSWCDGNGSEIYSNERQTTILVVKEPVN